MKVKTWALTSLHNLEHSQYAINLHTICTEANIENHAVFFRRIRYDRRIRL